MEILVALINVIWLYVCLAPALLILAIFLIRVGLRHTRQPQEHKHKWVFDPKGSTIDIPPVEPNPPGWKDLPMDKAAFPDNWFGTFRDKYTCECGAKKTKTHRELY